MQISKKDAELPTKAEDMFCFATYAASHAINRAYAPLLKPLGLTYPQYITLTFLWNGDGLGVGELATLMQMESSTLTPLLKRLEKLGHIKRKRGSKDERQVFVHLTQSGKDIQNHAPGITACMVEGTGLSPDKLNQLVATLNELTKGLARP